MLLENRCYFAWEHIMNMHAVLVHDTESLADDWPALPSLNTEQNDTVRCRFIQ